MSRKLLALMVTAALALMAGACGSPEEEGFSGQGRGSAGAEKPTTVETVRVAYRETAAERTAKTSFEMAMTVPAAGPGTSDKPAPMTMAMTGRGAVDFSGESSVLEMEMFGMGPVEMRQVGDVVYMNVPREFATQMPGSKPWVRMNLDEMHGQPGAGLDGLQGGAASDPTRQLEYLRGVSASVEKLGREEVRGVRTTRYRAVVDLEREAARQDADVRKAYDGLIEQLGTSRMPVEVWIDGQNRVRRYAQDMTVPVPEDAGHAGTPKGAGMRMRVVVDYYDFGTPVEVQAPPRAQTMDGSKLLAAQRPAAR